MCFTHTLLRQKCRPQESKAGCMARRNRPIRGLWSSAFPIIVVHFPPSSFFLFLLSLSFSFFLLQDFWGLSQREGKQVSPLWVLTIPPRSVRRPWPLVHPEEQDNLCAEVTVLTKNRSPQKIKILSEKQRSLQRGQHFAPRRPRRVFSGLSFLFSFFEKWKLIRYTTVCCFVKQNGCS